MLQFPKKTGAPFQGAFIHEIVGDSMEPLYMPRLHAVACLPVERYTCEGIYLIGGLDLYRCQRQGRSIHMRRENPLYAEYDVSVDRFNSTDLALVVADITIRNPTALWFMRHQIVA